MIIPEYVIQTMIIRGLRVLRADSRLIDQLFKNLSQVQLQQMRSFLKEQVIDLCLNYPQSELKVPAIVILLKGESETQAFLGSSMGTGTPDEFSFDGDVEGEILGGAATVTDMSGEGRVVFGPYRAAGGTNNTLRVTDSRLWATDQFAGQGLTLRIVAGKGVGQIRTITTNTLSVIMVSANWNSNPDGTSIFEVRSSAPEVLGQPSKLYDRRDVGTVLERTGNLEAKNYQIQVIGANQEQTIFLTVILKALFELSRIFLEGQGITNLKLGATDFVPRTEYQPSFAYMRAINLEFVASNDIFQELGPLAKTVQIALETNDAEYGEVTDSFTTTDVGLPPVVVEGT